MTMPGPARDLRGGRRFAGRAAVLVLLGALLAACLPGIATAAQRHTVQSTAAFGIVGQRPSVYLTNDPGGYYMGRAFDGNHFDRTRYADNPTGIYYSKGNHYAYRWGRSVLTDSCLWIGPPAGTNPAYSTEYLSTSTAVNDQCTTEQEQRLQVRTNFGQDFNCPDHWANGGMTVTVTGGGSYFMYNMHFTSDYGTPSLIGGADSAVFPGEKVQYRYTTKDGRYAVVYHPTLGWGFIFKSAIPAVHTGYYALPGDFRVPGTRCQPQS
jgi:hypothetical protein